jgi:hypothetical protein
MDGWMGCLLVSFGQSFEMCIDSVEKSYEKIEEEEEKILVMACYLNVTTPKWSFLLLRLSV